MNIKKLLCGGLTPLLSFLFYCNAVCAQDYELVWSDEFDTNTLGINWNVEATDAPYNNELQAYTARPENVTVADGNLILTARRESQGGKKFTSGRVNTKHRVAFTHGKIEARIKLPQLANGLWPAFWMMGNDFDEVDWPKCGEIDISEMGMKEAIANGTTSRTVAGTIHWGENAGSHQQYSGGNVTVDHDLTGDYHIFTAVWDDDYLRFYVDNSTEPYFTKMIKKGFGSGDYFHKPFFIILNMAVGGDYTGIFQPDAVTALPADGSEAKMYVDYVRIYQKKGQNNVTTGINDLQLSDQNSTNNLQNVTGALYNMAGQRVSSDYRGMVIGQGRKLIRNI